MVLASTTVYFPLWCLGLDLQYWKHTFHRRHDVLNCYYWGKYHQAGSWIDVEKDIDWTRTANDHQSYFQPPNEMYRILQRIIDLPFSQNIRRWNFFLVDGTFFSKGCLSWIEGRRKNLFVDRWNCPRCELWPMVCSTLRVIWSLV
jgi:hypothetical protein